MSFKRMLILLVVFCMIFFSGIVLHAENLNKEAAVPETVAVVALRPDMPMLASALPTIAFDDFEDELMAQKDAEEKTSEKAEQIALEETKQETKQEPQTETPEEEPKETEKVETEKKWDGEVLNARNGVVYGPSGKETYYNLDMTGVIREMRRLGYSEKKYPYHIREDGVKMLGDYVMCAANLDEHPKGDLVETSLGTAIVCDTGSFAKENRTQLDIAVNW